MINNEIHFIMCIGIPGSGKSTWVKNILDNYTVICPDEIRKEKFGNINDQSHNSKVWDIAIALINYNLGLGKNVVLDATNCKSSDRKKILNNIHRFIKSFNSTSLSLKTKAMVFSIIPEFAKRRIKNDIENKLERSNVPEHVVDRMYNQLLNGYKNIEKEFDEVQSISMTEWFQVPNIKT